jgi:hypothetical protein
MAREGTVAEVATLPNCDICKQNGDESVPAGFDGRTKDGPWAFMCSTHFGLYGTGLGTGCGQRLVLAVKEEPQEREGYDCDRHGMRHPLIAHWECFEDLLKKAVADLDPYADHA